MQAEKTLESFGLDLMLNSLEVCLGKTYSSIFLLGFSFTLTLTTLLVTKRWGEFPTPQILHIT